MTLSLHFLLILLSFAVFVYRYQKCSLSFFSNYNFYILFFAIFYISLPSVVSLLTGHSWVDGKPATIDYTSSIGLYFVFIFFTGYLISPDRLNLASEVAWFRSKYFDCLVVIFFVLASLYVLTVIIFNLDAFLSVYGRRGLQSDLNEYLYMRYKIKPIFIAVVVFVSYFVLKSKRLYCLFVFSPFVLYDIMLSSRGYIYATAVVVFLLLTFHSRKVNPLYLAFSMLAIASIAVWRALGSEFNWALLFQVFYEFIFTWSTTHIIHESNIEKDFIEAAAYGLLRFFPSFAYELFFDKYVSYNQIVVDNNPLGWGLAGSVVAEALSFKSGLVTFAFPFLVLFYSFTINVFLRSKTYTGFIVFIVAVIYVRDIFRYSFLEIAMYPLYVVFFVGFLIPLLDVFNRASKFER
ncbi:hypothetical protein [Stutzerimonas nitrititolerans]|uniref:hypothetical protein n=1 Tax=Stutzerimonas nitrititolerans TaxID=2482751 RepID=UPI003F8097F8